MVQIEPCNIKKDVHHQKHGTVIWHSRVNACSSASITTASTEDWDLKRLLATSTANLRRDVQAVRKITSVRMSRISIHSDHKRQHSKNETRSSRKSVHLYSFHAQELSWLRPQALTMSHQYQCISADWHVTTETLETQSSLHPTAVAGRHHNIETSITLTTKSMSSSSVSVSITWMTWLRRSFLSSFIQQRFPTDIVSALRFNLPSCPKLYSPLHILHCNNFSNYSWICSLSLCGVYLSLPMISVFITSKRTELLFIFTAKVMKDARCFAIDES